MDILLSAQLVQQARRVRSGLSKVVNLSKRPRRMVLVIRATNHSDSPEAQTSRRKGAQRLLHPFVRLRCAKLC